VKRSRLPLELVLALATPSLLAWTACDYGSVDPSVLENPDAGEPGGDDPGEEGDDGDDSGDGSSGGGGGADGGGGGGSIQHLSFPIDEGTTHAAFECGDCHGDLANPTDPAALACTGCHLGSHDEQTMASTHGAGPGVGELYEFAAPACVTCHPQGDVYPRSQHDRNALDHHEGEPCSACHPAQTDLAPATFADTKCTPCHSGNPGEDD
jgi:hypothetical protein